MVFLLRLRQSLDHTSAQDISDEAIFDESWLSKAARLVQYEPWPLTLFLGTTILKSTLADVMRPCCLLWLRNRYRSLVIVRGVKWMNKCGAERVRYRFGARASPRRTLLCGNGWKIDGLDMTIGAFQRETAISKERYIVSVLPQFVARVPGAMPDMPCSIPRCFFILFLSFLSHWRNSLNILYSQDRAFKRALQIHQPTVDQEASLTVTYCSCFGKAPKL